MISDLKQRRNTGGAHGTYDRIARGASDKKRLLTFIFLAAAVQSYSSNTLLATKKVESQFTCPVCRNGFLDYEIGSTNSFGGQDRDFLRRAGGDQPVLIFPKTCPACFYSGYRYDFSSGINIPPAVKQQILQQGMLKPGVQIPKGAKSYEIPASARYDLIAQTYQLRGKPEEDMAQQFLSASWATRLESYLLPAAILGEELTEKVKKREGAQWKPEQTGGPENHVLGSIQRGRQCAEAARSLDGEERMIAALAAIHILRLNGENTEVLQILPLLRTVMPEKQFADFARLISDSIARERDFQSKAVLLFEKVAPTKQDSKDKAALTYLCGELHRRLENWDKARSYYEQCLKMAGRPRWLEEWVKEQQALLPDRASN